MTTTDDNTNGTDDQTYELIFNRKAAANPKIAFANINDFVEAPEIDQEIRDSLVQYMRYTDGSKLPKNDKGYPIFEWKKEDAEHKAQYVPTWSERYGWGVMRSPWSPKVPQSTDKKLVARPSTYKTETKAMFEELTKELKEIKEMVEYMYQRQKND